MCSHVWEDFIILNKSSNCFIFYFCLPLRYWLSWLLVNFQFYAALISGARCGGSDLIKMLFNDDQLHFDSYPVIPIL